MANGKTKTNLRVTRLRRRYGSLAARLKGPGLILQGTITERTITSSDDGGKNYGPYYQWTRKLSGKTVNVNLSSSQAEKYQTAINNNKKLEATIKEMRDLSLKICEATTIGVKKRKSGRIAEKKP